VVQAEARRGEGALRAILDTDEGALRLGEVALVPHSGPISQRDHLFLETLFDENAACHIALGQAYRTSVQGGPDMGEDEALAVGINDSLVHVDFMIGSAEVDVDGLLESGAREPVMRAGEWALTAVKP
jgi:aminopeptidase